MKSLVVTLSLIWLSATVFSQTTTLKGGASSYINTANGMLGFGGNLSIEHPLGKHWSVSGAAGYTRGKGTFSTMNYCAGAALPYQITVWSVRPEMRWYSKQSMRGLFCGLGINAGLQRYEGTETSEFALKAPSEQGWFVQPSLTWGVQLPLTTKLRVECNSSIQSMQHLLFREHQYLVSFGLRLGYVL